MDADLLLREAKNIFEFLAQAQLLKDSPVRDVRKYENVFWLSDFPAHPAICVAYQMPNPDPEAELLSVSRLAQEDHPEPDDQLKPWLDGDILDADAEVKLRDWIPAHDAPNRIPRMLEDGPSDKILLEDEADIRSAGEPFVREWKDWADKEQRDRPVRELYTSLFGTYQTAQSHSESFELVLGVGALAWEPPGHAPVLRHAMVFPAEITFDDESGQIAVRHSPGNTPLSVELDMLDPSLVTRQVAALRDATHGYHGHPLDRALIGQELTRFAHAIDSRGAYIDELAPSEIGQSLKATFAPALILRKRSQRGLIDMFFTIRDQIDEAGEVVPGLLPLIDPSYTPLNVPDDSPGGMIDVGDDELFLPMPVNDRQLKVIQAINRKSQVVVQGPPGTGKTHTAAALLSHLLAQGKRVLVTAHTDRALHEVRGKLPEDIRPLSVAVIGNSQSEMADLRVAIETISSRADEHEASDAKRTIERHLSAIDRLRRERSETYVKLRESREAETLAKQVGQYTGTLAAMARKIESEAPNYQWINQVLDISAGSKSPVSDTEASEWLSLLNSAELAADASESLLLYPAIESLPSAAEFASLVDAEAIASTRAQEFSSWLSHPHFPGIAALDDEIRSSLRERTSKLANSLDDLEARSEGWVADAVQDIRTGRRQTWQSRADQVADLIEQVRPLAIAVGSRTQVTVDLANLATLGSMAAAIRAHVRQGNHIKVQVDGTPKLGVFSPKVLKQAQSFFDTVRVNGLPPTTDENLTLFLNFVEGTQILDALDRSWPSNIIIPDEDTLDERLQWHVTELGQLLKVLSMADSLASTEIWVRDHGLKAPNWADLADVQSYAALVDAASSADALGDVQTQLANLQSTLELQTSWDGASPVIRELSTSVVRRDRNSFLVALNRLTHLHKVRSQVERLQALEAKICTTAEPLIEEVHANPDDPTWKERLAGLSQAWDWASAASWIKVQEHTDVNSLQRRLDTIESQIRREIEGLAATRAWSHAVDESRMSGTARAYLRQYAQLVKRLGKGTGKYAVKQQQEIKQALDQCRSSVPVWIMPLYRIASQFKIESNMFDVVLVDEASQAGLEAAFLQYLAPKIIVVGDDKQVSPSAVGVDQQQLRDLANQYLSNNPFKASWQDPKRSYFDEATMRFGGKITLVEHRRCVPEIIGFSNKIAYEPENIRLLPVRQRKAGSLTPIRRVHVPTGYEKGKTNPAEADAIVAQLLECSTDPAYEGKTFGVISLTGKEQAKIIENRLLTQLSPEEWATRDLSCGDASDFQGAERDVVFLSMVKTAEPGRRVGSLTADMYVQRYNVAASRAKDQMWLFHSILLSDLGNPQDMRHSLLDYVSNVEQRQDQPDDRIRTDLAPEDDRIEPFDSLFEQRVFNRIHGRGYSVIPQFPAEGYRIDLVVLGANGKLAVECDGDAWHGPDAYLKDLARQRDLERCGWTFFRVRESAYYLDPEEALSGLWQLLEDLNRVPNLSVQTPAPENEPVAEAALEPSTEVMHGPGKDSFVPKPESEPAVISQPTAHPTVDNSPSQNSALAVRAEPSNKNMATKVAWDLDSEWPISGAVEPDPKRPVSESDYSAFSGTAVATQSAPLREIIECIIEIVQAEGPVLGDRLHRAYVEATGGRRVGRQIASDLNKAISAAVRQGRLIEDNPLGEPGVKRTTYRMADQPEYRIRALGPRTLEEVPPRELAARILWARASMGWDEQDEPVYRLVLNDMGLSRLTSNVRLLLDGAHYLAEKAGTESK